MEILKSVYSILISLTKYYIEIKTLYNGISNYYDFYKRNIFGHIININSYIQCLG